MILLASQMLETMGFQFGSVGMRKSGVREKEKGGVIVMGKGVVKGGRKRGAG